MHRDAAVAIIRWLSPISGEEARYLIIRRVLNPLDPWSGHFAFPGGRREPQDANMLAVCLRETREECGLTLAREHLVATLPITEAGNAFGHPVRVTPFLFELPATAPHPQVLLDPVECASHHWVPESQLRHPDNHVSITPLPGSDRSFPAIILEDGHIWGFTYKVLAALLSFSGGPVAGLIESGPVDA